MAYYQGGGPVMAPSPGFYSWMRHHYPICLRLHYLICFLLLVLITVPFFTHYYLSTIATDQDDLEVHRSRSKLDHPDDLGNTKLADIKYHVEDLQRIKISVNNELRELESKRQKLHSEINGYNSQLDELKVDYEKSLVEMQQLVATIENRKQEIDEMIQRNKPEIQAPSRILPGGDESVVMPSPRSTFWCRMHNCFDFSRCSITSQLPIYVYDPAEYETGGSKLMEYVRGKVTNSLFANPHVTDNPKIACLYVVLVGEVEGALNSSALQDHLHNLPYWRGDGRNHILVNAARTPSNKDVFDNVDRGRAILAQSAFTSMQFRPGFDIILPPFGGKPSGEVWDELPLISPARRKHLLTFQGEYRILEQFLQQPTATAYVNKNPEALRFQSNNHGEQGYNAGAEAGRGVARDYVPKNEKLMNHANADVNHNPSDMGVKKNQETLLDNPAGDEFDNVPNQDGANYRIGRNLQSLEGGRPAATSTVQTGAQELVAMEKSVVETLKRMQNLFQEGAFIFDFTCHRDRVTGINAEWSLCGTAEARQSLLLQSTFALIIAPTNHSIVSSTLTQIRVFESLQYGAIPVILGDYVELPFSELIQWHRAAIVLPKARVTELHFYIQSIADSDILRIRYEGRLIWEHYFGTTLSIVDTLVASLRTRLNIPALPVTDSPSPSAFNGSFVPLTEEVLEIPPEAEEVLGPMEAAFPSPRFQRNFTMTLEYVSPAHDPFHLYPHSPFDPTLPAEAKFLGSSLGFRPIAKGQGGAGKEFHQALGGNMPREQFTIVMLTYERDAVLMNALRRLKGLPHLNKVLVVWNSPAPPGEDLKWPSIGVPVHVIKTAKNSLNNRFLPFDLIDTEAILSIDDDAHLRQDEITFGFRVWREARDRLVGFPGRFHSWSVSDQSWLYNANYSCELSMVLTGAAFFHKYYAYMYSQVMPHAIRDKVDEYMNCEDLAMNFLVSHLTRKPPIKVTSRWTFRCPGCPQALSEDDSHFQERHKCLNFFTRVYGYMPLLNTQFRADSVLFKTRIPHDKQKCFKFI